MLIIRSIAPLILAALSITSLVLGGEVAALGGRAAATTSGLDGIRMARNIQGFGGCKGGVCGVGEALHAAVNDLPLGPAINAKYGPGGVLHGTGSPLSPLDAHFGQGPPLLSHLDGHAHALGRRDDTSEPTDYLIKYYVGYVFDPMYTATYTCSPVFNGTSFYTRTRTYPGSSVFLDTNCGQEYSTTLTSATADMLYVSTYIRTETVETTSLETVTIYRGYETQVKVVNVDVTAYYNYTDTVTHTYPVTETYKVLGETVYYTVGYME